MPKAKPDKPNVLDMTAGELVALLVDEAGESLRTLEAAIGIDHSVLSRYRSGTRLANETDWRTLANYAVKQKVAKIV